MWTPDHSYWPQKKNSSYYPALFEIPFPSWKITEKFNFSRKNSHFPLKKKKPKMVWIVWGVFFWGYPEFTWKMIKSLPEMTPFWAFYFQFPCSKTAVFHGFSLKFTQILHFKPLLNRFETYNIESCFKIWFSIKKNNWKLVSIITFRNRQLAKFWKNHRPQLYHLSIIYTQKLLNSIKKR